MPLLSDDEAWQLILEREKMLWGHIRRRIRFLPPGVEYEDVLATARLRMFQMLQNWDPERSPEGDVKLYANQCAGWSAGLSISDLIPASEGRYAALDRTCAAAWDRFVAREGRSPSVSEIIVEVGDNPRMGRFSKPGSLSEGAVSRWLHTGNPMGALSIDAPRGPEPGGFTFHDVLTDGTPDMIGVIDDRLRRSRVESALPGLSARQRDLLKGVVQGESFKSIGERWGLSRERVRQIFGETVNDIRTHHGLAPYTRTPSLIRANPEPPPVRPPPTPRPLSPLPPLSTPPRSTAMPKKPTCAWPGCTRPARSRSAPLCQRDSLRANRMANLDPYGAALECFADGEVKLEHVGVVAEAWERYRQQRKSGFSTPPAQPAQPAPVVELSSVPMDGGGGAGRNPLARPLREATRVSDLMAHPGIEPLLRILGLDAEDRADLLLADAYSVILGDLQGFSEALELGRQPTTYPGLIGALIQITVASRLTDVAFGATPRREPEPRVGEVDLDHIYDLACLAEQGIEDVGNTIQPLDAYIRGEDGDRRYPHQVPAIRHSVLITLLQGILRTVNVIRVTLEPPEPNWPQAPAPGGHVAHGAFVVPAGAESPGDLAKSVLDAVLAAIPEGALFTAMPEGTVMMGEDDSTPEGPTDDDPGTDGEPT